eukprot:UN22942
MKTLNSYFNTDDMQSKAWVGPEYWKKRKIAALRKRIAMENTPHLAALSQDRESIGRKRKALKYFNFDLAEYDAENGMNEESEMEALDVENEEHKDKEGEDQSQPFQELDDNMENETYVVGNRAAPPSDRLLPSSQYLQEKNKRKQPTISTETQKLIDHMTSTIDQSLFQQVEPRRILIHPKIIT